MDASQRYVTHKLQLHQRQRPSFSFGGDVYPEPSFSREFVWVRPWQKLDPNAIKGSWVQGRLLQDLLPTAHRVLRTMADLQSHERRQIVL